MDAASTASALPFTNPSYRCSNVPAPPDAITGIDTAFGHGGRQAEIIASLLSIFDPYW